jgi:hypothetical protein
MTLFQWLSLSFLAGLLLIEVWQAARSSSLRNVWWLRVAVWLATAAAIARPEWITQVARTLGIQRGADLVTYGAVLLLLITSLYFYARYLRLQQQITALTRRLAQLEARPRPPQQASERPPEAKTPQRGEFATSQPEETA